MDRSKAILSASALALYTHFALQLLAGGLLATVYRADPKAAHATATALHQGGWRILQGFHYWGSAIMIVHSILHLAAVTWAGWYRGPQTRAYLAALALAGLSLAFQLTGNALPWDRHGAQTAAVEGAIAARVPVVGPAVSKMVLAGDEVTGATLARWYGLHWLVLPAVLVLALAVGLSAPRKGKIARWSPFVPAGAALALALLVAAPLGSAAMFDDYGRFDAKPSWYTVPMHGLLVWGDRVVPGGGWIGAALVPGLIAFVLLALPFLKKTKPGLVRGLLIAFGILGALAAITSGGEYAPLVGTRDPKLRPAVVARSPVGAKEVALAAKGRSLFRAQNCNGCHGEDGLKGVGGPSLKNVWKEHSEADYYVRYIKNPQSVEKGSTMPAYPGLKEEELRAMAEFLRFAR